MLDPTPEPRSRGWQFADRVGAAASFLCAIHCAALPFVLALLPLLGLTFLADHAFERGFVLFASVLALVSLTRGYRRHRQPLALSLALPGLSLLLIGVTFAESYSIGLHSTLVACGGLLVASAHFINLRMDRRWGHQHGPQCVH
ncbi:MAG: MerC domain-containing protein [Dyella sp.]